MPLLPELAARLPGAQLRGTGPAFRLVFPIDDIWLDARARENPGIEIFVRTTKLPFSARFRPHEGDLLAPPPQPFEDLFDIDTSDTFLSGWWIDDASQDAMVASLWERPGPAVSGFEFHVEDGEVCLRRMNDTDIDQLERGLRAAAIVAARAHRVAAQWLDVARSLGGTTTADRWDASGGFEAVLDRGATTVRIDNVLSLPGEDRDDAWLRTRIRARRVAPDGDRWGLWQPKVRRAHRPRIDADASVEHARWEGVAADPARLLSRMKPVEDLLATANPDALWTDGDEIGLWWTGVVQSPIFLGPAVEAIARLAIEIAAPTGPYR
jgi:hypothetical protein